MENITDITVDVAKGVGRLFYLALPSETSFPTPEECPNYLEMAIPYFVLLILLEGGVNWTIRGKAPHVADSLTNISCGLLMTLGQMLTRVAMVGTYNYLHTHYHLVVLPWDSALTWVITAVLLDLGYYWFHRASHEFSLFWAVHQVHHSSEEFNLTVAVRQPVFEGLFYMSHWFYLPICLLIPTSQFLVHSELNFLYQFWIHTELLGDLGPLGFIFNTASHHKVHHGANRYCLDKNYGGFLCIWDRMFGTFQEELPTEEIIYGLVDQPNFFDVLKHQLFYFKLLHQKAANTDNWVDWCKAWLAGPGWFPGLSRLGNNELVDKIPRRKKHRSPVPVFTDLYLITQVVGVLLFHDDLSKLQDGMTWGGIALVSLFILWTLASVGLHYDQHPLTGVLEFARCLVSLLVSHSTGGWTEGTIPPAVFSLWMAVSLILTATSIQGGNKDAHLVSSKSQ